MPPGHDGVEVLKTLKREFPNRPVLILGMYPENLHATRLLKLGAAGYINKDCVMAELISALHKVSNSGRYVSPSLAERLALHISDDTNRPLHERLSDREYRVMWLLASGKQLQEIAAELFVTSSTVSSYRARIFNKLELRNNAELVWYAIKHNLVD